MIGTLGTATAVAGCAGTGGQEDTTKQRTVTTEVNEMTGTQASTAPKSTGTATSDRAALSSWFENVENYDKVVDATTEDEVQIRVGTKANGSAYGFEPAAVRVTPGTVVTWTWTGKGESHNVVAADGSYESELTSSEGHTFSHTFDGSSAAKYYCGPHKLMGMKGAVIVE